jgi:eukaryotic-like serine/threonine-protein kinase
MLPGAVIDERFEIEALAAHGGMGAVYRARDRAGGGRVAVKILSHDEPRLYERFLREARVLADLCHPAIVRYVAHGLGGSVGAGAAYLAMEWLDGEDLGARLMRGAVPAADALRVVARAAEALGAAHERGLVHRDVKPSNIFLLGKQLDRVKILDFGVVQVRDGRSLTRAGHAVGTPRYMSPEQARGERNVDARADVFALGCVLYACLTGRNAFAGDDDMAILAKILVAEVAPPSQLVAVPPQVDRLVARMLAKERADRMADGNEVAAAIARIDLGARGGVAAAPAPRPALGRGEQRLVSVVLVGRCLAGERAQPGDVAGFGGQLESAAGGEQVMVVNARGGPADQAAQAARAALALRSGREAPISLATGPALLGVEARGPAAVVDRAAALLRAARHGEIRLDEVTAGLLGARFEVGGDEVGLLLLRERHALDEARTLLGRPTPCVGRDRELAALAALYAECAAEAVARAALITGGPGTGKSRLRRELLLRTPAQALVLFGRGDPMRAGSPFGPLAEALRREAGIVDGESMPVRRRKLRARLARQLDGDGLRRATEFLGELAAVPASGAEASVELKAARQDSRLMNDQIRLAWLAWLAAECRAQPVILVLEDLHYGDLPTVRLVDTALSETEAAFLVVALARPEVRDLFPRLWEGRAVLDISLPELTRRAAARLVRAVLGDGTDPATVASIVERAGGNAFYLEELIRTAAEGRLGEGLPATVLAMVQARLEALPADGRRILRAASIFGDVFWGGGVRALVGDAGSRVDDWLATLAAREMVSARGDGYRFPGEHEFAFRHGLVREGAYSMLTREDRALGHRLAGEWLERAGERDAGLLASHFELGGDAARAAAHWQRAAEQALEANDLDNALQRVRRALACGAEGEALGPLRHLEGRVRVWRAEFDEAERLAREALAHLERGDALWYRATTDLIYVLGRRGDSARMLALVKDAVAAGAAPGAEEARLVACAMSACELATSGHHQLADEIVAAIAAEAPRVAGSPLLPAWVQRAIAFRDYFVRGDLPACLAAGERSAAAFEQAGNQRAAAVDRVNLAYFRIELGDHAAAAADLRAVLARAEAMGLAHCVAMAKQNLGLALFGLGQIEEAEALERAAAAAFAAQGDLRLSCLSRVNLARILLVRGAVAEAEAEAQAALASAPAGAARAFALAALASAHLAAGGSQAVAGALAAARQAAEMVGEGSLEEGQALVRLVLAEALRASGDVPGARAAALRARGVLLERAVRLADVELRRKFLEAVPEHRRTLALADELA